MKSSREETIPLKSMRILRDVIILNSDIPHDAWCTAFLCSIARIYKKDGLSYKQFEKDAKRSIKAYENYIDRM